MGNGSLSRVYFSTAFESAFAAATLNKSFLMKVSGGPKHTDEEDDNVNGTVAEHTLTRTARLCEFTLSGPLTSNLLALLMKYFMHAVPSTTGAGDPYSHTHTDIDVTSPYSGAFNAVTANSFTMAIQVAGIASYIDRYDGCIVTALTLSGDGTGKPQFSATVQTIGAVTATTEPAVALPTEGYYIGRKTTLSVGGVAVAARLGPWSLALNNGIAILDRAGSTAGNGTAIDHVGRYTVDLTYTIDEGAVSEAGGHDDYDAQTARAYILVAKGDTNRDATYTIPTGRLVDSYPVEVGPHGVYKVQRKVKALLTSLASPAILTSVVRNDVSSYA